MTVNMKNIAFLVLIALLGFAGYAQQPIEGSGENFKTDPLGQAAINTVEDGQITQEEAAAPPLTAQIGVASDAGGTALNSPTNADEIYFKVVFSEAIKHDATAGDNVFTKEDITCSNCNVLEVAVVDPSDHTTYNVKVGEPMIYVEPIRIILKEKAVASLLTGVENSRTPSALTNYDGIPPLVRITGKGAENAIEWTGGRASLDISIIESNRPDTFDPNVFIQGITVLVGGGEDAGASIALKQGPNGYTSVLNIVLTITDKTNDVDGIQVRVAPGIITDLAGNQNAEFLQDIPDYTAPVLLTVEIVAGTKPNGDVITEATNGPIAFKLTFSEAIDAGTFAKGDISCANCDVTGIVPVGNDVPNGYIVTVMPDQEDNVIITLVGGSVSSAVDATRFNQEISSSAILYDLRAPTVLIELQTGASDYTKVAAIPIKITFADAGSGSIQGFESKDIEATDSDGGSLVVSGLLQDVVNPLIYTATVTATSEGTIGIKVPAGLVTDAAGNMNTESNILSITYDGTAPVVTIVGTGTADAIEWTDGVASLDINIDDDNLDFYDLDITGDITVSANGDGVNIEVVKDPLNPKHYTVTLRVADPAIDRTGIAVKVPSITDLAGNQSTQVLKDIRYSAPVLLTARIDAPTNPDGNPIEAVNGRIAFKLTFSEAIDASTFVAGDISCLNCDVTDIVPVGNDVPNGYIVTVMPDQEDNVIITLVGGSVSAFGDASKLNQEISSSAILYDLRAPTVLIGLQTGASDAYTKVAAIPIKITFADAGSGSIQGFDETDITATDSDGGSLVVSGLLQTDDPLIYTATVTATSEGMIGIKVPAGLVTDAAGNMNTESNILSITYDGTAPTYTLSGSSPFYTKGPRFPITVTFNEALHSDLEASDVYFPDGQGIVAEVIKSAGTNNYTVNLNVPGNIDFNFYIKEGAVTDLAGNANEGNAPTLNIIKDETSPEVVITSMTDGVLSEGETSVYEIALRFVITDVNLKSFTEAEFLHFLSATDADFSSVQKVSSTEFTSTLTIRDKSSSSTSTITITGLTDLAGNVYANDDLFSYAYKPDPLTVTIGNPTDDQGQAIAGPINAGPISFQVRFNQAVDEFVQGDMTFESCTFESVVDDASSSNTYTVTVTPTSEGNVQITIPDGAVKSFLTGVVNTAKSSSVVIYDTTPPTVTITSGETSPTSKTVVPIRIELSEAVEGQSPDEIKGALSVSLGTIGELTPVQDEPNVYTTDLTITEDEDTEFVISIAEGALTDMAGNGIAADDNLFAVTYKAFSVSIKPREGQTSPTNSNEFYFTVEFSLPIFTGDDANGKSFVKGDLNCEGCTISEFYGNDQTPLTYTVKVQPTGSQFTLSLEGGTVKDASLAEKPNPKATSPVVLYDTEAPGISSIVSTLTGLLSDGRTNAQKIPFEITFNEEVEGFTAVDLSITNGAISTADDETLQAKEGSNTVFMFTVDVASGESGDIVVDVDINSYGVVTDLAGNALVVSGDEDALFSFTYDVGVPVVTISSSIVDATSKKSIPIQIELNEAVKENIPPNLLSVSSGITAGDLEMTSTLGEYPALYRSILTVGPDFETGTINISIDENMLTDLAGNQNEASSYSISYLKDDDVPSPGTDGEDFTVLVSSSEAGLTNLHDIPVTFTFSEPPIGFDAGDITVTGGALKASSLMAKTDNASIYDAIVLPSGDGTVTVKVAGGAVTDAAGNGNTGSGVFSIDSDKTVPTVVISSTAQGPTNLTGIPVTFTFSEPVQGFLEGDITFGNATIVPGSLKEGTGGSVYTADATAKKDGKVTVSLSSNKVTDRAGNSNTATDLFSIVYDGKRPSVKIASKEKSPTGLNEVLITVTFSEPPIGFDAGDITVTGGALKANSLKPKAGNALTYEATVSLSVAGTVTVKVAGGAVTDEAGNGNTGSDVFSIEHAPNANTVLGLPGTEKATVILYPNPSLEVINLNLQPVQDVRVKLSSLDGRAIKDYGTQKGGVISLSVASLSPGTYLLQIASGDKTLVRRIIVN